MKTLLWIASLCVTGALAHADLIVDQKIESAMMNGNATLKVKGDQGRIDTPSPVGNVSVIFDANSGKMMNLMHAQKMVMQMDSAAMMRMATEAMKAQGTDPATLKPVATGKKQKVGTWDTDEYTVTVSGMTIHLWSTSSIPNSAALKKQMTRITKAMSGGSIDPNSMDVPGIVVKTDMESPAGKMSTTITSIREENVDPSEFTVPADYKKMELPTGAVPQ